MSISIVTFANLGKKTNLKSTDIEPVIRTFEQKGDLEQVICQLNKNFFFKKTENSVPMPVHYVLRTLEHFGRISRTRIESIFDYFASHKLVKTTAVLLHGGDFLPRTIIRAHKNSSIVINIAVMAELHTFVELEKGEAHNLALKIDKGVYARMYEHYSDNLKFDYIIALSDFSKRSYVLRGFQEEKIYVASPDIDIKRFSVENREWSATTFKVVNTGYTTSLKGLHYLLDAWEQLKLPNAELLLIGGYGDMPEELRARYEAIISKDPSIKWVGNSPTPEQYYHDASLFVFPSLTEGFGRVTLEAMACGIPVITTENAQGIVEDSKTGFVVPIRDSNSIAEKIRYLYDHRDIAEKMGMAARKAVEDKKPFGDAVYEIYQEILRREHVESQHDRIHSIV